MIISLLLAIVISVFSVGAGLILLRRFRDWRFGFLAGLCLFASTWVLMTQVSRLFHGTDGLSLTLSGFENAFPTVVLSLMALSAVFFLERIIRGRAKAEQDLKLAQVSLDRASIPAFWFTSEGRVRYVNEGACAHMGDGRQELLSMTIHDLAPFYSPADWTRDWLSLKEQGSTNLELHFNKKDGQLFPADVTAIYVGSSEDEELACMFVRDISERKHAEADLRVAKATAESANRAKGEFLSTMSHELRTPLNAIIGFSEMIEMEMFGPLGSERYSSCISDVLYSARHLLGIINGVLDLSKAEAGGLTLHEEEVHLPEIFSQCIRLFKEKALHQGVTLSVDCPATSPTLQADPRILRQIVINLLSNAIKFTSRGGTIEVSSWVDEQGACMVSVVDSGCGIAKQDLDKVLDPFVQAENAMTRRHEGTGLGLPLVKEYMDLHGGTLDLESTLGVGTTVTIRFPPERLIQPFEDHDVRSTA